MDRAAVRVEALLPRGWLLVGALALAPLFAGGGGADAAFAAAVGGVLLAYSAFRSLASGVERAAAALVAWERVRPLWDAAARPAVAGEPRYAAAGARVGARAIVQASGVVHRPHGRAADVLRGVDLSIGDGDRVLLVGSSGGGKSTLASILAGCRAPSAGLVLQRGLDVSTLGETAWRRGAVLAPQFHENHVLSAPVLFNALMGRAWPPSREDVVACEDVLRGLRLDGVVARMPGGLGQMLGDSGWQLSHGERSRLFIARALLQKADLTLLDESFAALDPATLKETLAFVESRANALVVVAHE
jgi:ATP-binding cassette subfamily B protein